METADDAAATFVKDGNADTIAREITRSLETYGAVLITNHGVPDQVLHDLYDANKKLSLHSDDDKKRYAWDVRSFHGWMSSTSERFKGILVQYSESFVTYGYPAETNFSWPDDLSPGYRQAYSRAFDDSSALGKRLLTLLGLGLGLEVKVPKTGRWMSVPETPQSVIFQVGTQLEHISNGRLPASAHRVMFPENEDRFKERHSFGFFLHAPMDDVLVSLDSSKPIDPITCRDFFNGYMDNYRNKDNME